MDLLLNVIVHEGMAWWAERNGIPAEDLAMHVEAKIDYEEWAQRRDAHFGVAVDRAMEGQEAPREPGAEPDHVDVSAAPVSTVIKVSETGEIEITAGRELTVDEMGGDFIVKQFTSAVSGTQQFLFRNLHNGMPIYDFITANDDVTDEMGRKIHGATNGITKARSAAQRFVGRHNYGNLNMDYNAGADHARKAIKAIASLEKQGVPVGRIHYSISESILDLLEKDTEFKRDIGSEKTVREFLSERAMLDVIKDHQIKVIGGKETRLVHMMPFGRVSFLGLTKLNIAHVAEQAPDDQQAMAEAIKPLAYAIGLVSNNLAGINEIEDVLLKQANKDPSFYKKVFEVALPPVAKLNYEMIRQIFDAESEVLRSL